MDAQTPAPIAASPPQTVSGDTESAKNSLLGVSVIYWIVLLIVGTACAMELLKMTPSQMFEGLVSNCVIFLFGHTIGQSSK